MTEDNCKVELVLMVEAGLSPMQAIVASTSNAARALGLQDQIGTIEVGKYADLLVINGDPPKSSKGTTAFKHVEEVLQTSTYEILTFNERLPS